MKIREPKRLIATILVIYIVYSSLILIDNFSRPTQEPLNPITGRVSTGVVFINILPNETAPEAVTAPENVTTTHKQAGDATLFYPNIPGTKAPLFFIGDFATNDVLEMELAIGETGEFIFNGKSYFIKIDEAKENGIQIEIIPPPTKYFVPFQGLLSIDLNLDTVPDITIEAIAKEDATRFLLTLSRIRPPAPRLPIGITLITKKLQNIKTLVWTLSGIALLLLIVIYFELKRSTLQNLNAEKILSGYITSAIKSGFTDSQIQEKLVKHGFAKKEVNHVLSRIRSKNTVPKKQ